MNPPRTRKCGACSKPRPKKRRPAHTKALDIPYEEYVRLNGGEVCGICKTPATGKRKLDRDHDHSGAGRPRGLLHARCNRALPNWVTPEWLRAAAKYLESAGKKP